MSGLPWTKFQDFYLRLGFLKVLVAVLSPERRSSTNGAIIRRLESPLFDSLERHKALEERTSRNLSALPTEKQRDSRFDRPNVADALLVAGNCPSHLVAITGPTTYKILDWGHDVGLVGRGNQVTERGLILRALTSESTADAFLTGNVSEWNPFRLDDKQRWFFLFHLAEIDRLTVEIVTDLSSSQARAAFGILEGSRIMSRGLIRVLEDSREGLSPRDIPAYRTAAELARTIAEELDQNELLDRLPVTGQRRPPKPLKPAQRKGSFGRKGNRDERKTTKNAEHQSVPRFEQMVDLGLLEKPREPDAAENESDHLRHWRYKPTEFCQRFGTALRRHDTARGPFLWHAFASSVISVSDARSQNVDDFLKAKYIWNAYQKIGRPMGHTPMDSIALFAMLSALEDGVVIEMADLHRMMLDIKKQSALPEHVFFASGNDLDRMFVLLKPGFVEKVRDAMRPIPGT